MYHMQAYDKLFSYISSQQVETLTVSPPFYSHRKWGLARWSHKARSGRADEELESLIPSFTCPLEECLWWWYPCRATAIPTVTSHCPPVGVSILCAHHLEKDFLRSYHNLPAGSVGCPGQEHLLKAMLSPHNQEPPSAEMHLFLAEHRSRLRPLRKTA